MFQPVAIPAGATSITLSFYAFVDSFETGALAYDYMTAYISEPNGRNPVGVAENQIHFPAGSPSGNFPPKTLAGHLPARTAPCHPAPPDLRLRSHFPLAQGRSKV